MMRDKSNRVCPVEMAGSLDNRIRKWVQHPRKILGPLIKEGMTVLDLGCGPGFFSIEMAEMVGESGLVIAADLQEGMLKKLEHKIQGTEIEKRIKLHRCEGNRIGVSEHVDFVLLFYVLHEVPDQEELLNEIKSILKPDGRILVVEPKLFHVSKKAFEATVKKAGEVGLKPVEEPKVSFSRAVLLKSGGGAPEVSSSWTGS